MPDKKLPDNKLYAELAHLFKLSAYKSEQLAEGVLENLDKLQALHDKAMARIVQIRRNAGLTATGKVAAFKTLKGEIAKEHKDWAKVLAGYAEQIERIEANAQPTRHPKDDVAHENRAREIRDVLRQLDPTEVEGRVLSATANGDDELLQAVMYSPVPFRFATEDLLDKISQQRWAREYPEDADKLRDLRTAQQEASSALKSVEAGLAREGLERIGEALPAPAAA